MRKLSAILICICILTLTVGGEDASEVIFFNDEENGIYCHGVGCGMEIALTFDDGPDEVYTKEILDILDEYNVNATFFVIGKNAEKHPELLLKEVSEGHEVGNHTYSHPHLKTQSDASLLTELRAADKVIFDASGVNPTLFRPPEGKCGKCVMTAVKEMGYTIILWSVDTRDWECRPVNEIVRNVKKNVKPGSIILFHDYVAGKSSTPEALKVIIPDLLEQGYTFVTITELIN